MPNSNSVTTKQNSKSALLLNFFRDKLIWKLGKRKVLLGFMLLFGGLLVTLLISINVKNGIDKYAESEFDFACKELKNKISTRLSAHAQLIRSQSALFENPAGVTKTIWKSSYWHQKIEKNLPGIQGLGFSEIISPDKLEEHEAKIRSEGFPLYSVYPKGKREIYTAIIYLEPFAGRNLRAFGYDMFSEHVRREAMEKARDYDIAALTGKIKLVQETDTDIQAGTLMYVPVYTKGMSTETVGERRRAIKGWTYSPYRMNDLMHGILGGYETIEGKNISLQIYDDSTYTENEILYDSRKLTKIKTLTSIMLTKRTIVDFNGKQWFLQFAQYHSPSSDFKYNGVWYTAIGGTSISILFFVLYISLLARIRANKLAEQLTNELSISEVKHRNLIENIHDIIFTLNTDGVISFVSPSWEALLGHSVEKVIGQTFQKFIHPDNFLAFMFSLNNLQDNGNKHEQTKYQMQHINGTWHWHIANIVPLKDKLGKTIGFEGTSRDITDQVIAEKALKESEDKLKALFVSMTEMVVLHELVFNENDEPIDYKIIDCNNAFTEITGLKKEEVLGKLATVVYNTNIPPFIKEYSEVALSGEALKFNTYYSAMDKHFLISVVSPKKGQFATVTADITALKQIEKVINDKNNELENFLYVSSHDLRTPLVNIQGFSQRLQKQMDSISTLLTNSDLEPQAKESIEAIINESVPKTLGFIYTNVAKMDVLINGLLTISRTGRVKMNVQEIDMNKLFEKILSALNFQINEISAKIVVKKLPNCYGDENLLNQLFTNIIVNALKYRNPNTQLIVEISANTNYNNAVYLIKDNGLGIAQKHLEKIWDVFFRVDSTSQEQGEGIGLSLCKRIVDKHYGKIWAESEQEIGTVFSVELKTNEFTE